MEELTIRLSQTKMQEIDHFRPFADGKSRTREEFVEDAVEEYLETLKNNPERLERGLGQLEQ